MADSNKPQTAEQKLIERALKNLKRAVDAVNHNYVAGVDDLRFANGDQWEQTEKQRRSRSGRPALTVNLLPEYIDQVTGDMRHNCPQIKFKPVDTSADVHLAKIRESLVNQIQYNSDARNIYINGGEMSVKCGYGAWRVLTRYCDDNPFLQEIYLEAINNPFLVYFDPRAKDVNYADARYAFILEKMPRSEFTDKYPKAVVPGEQFKVNTGLANELWYDKDMVTIAEYFEKSSETITICQMEDGTYITEDEYKDRLKSWAEDTKEVVEQMAIAPPQPQAPAGPQDLAPQAIQPQGAPQQIPQQLPPAASPQQGLPGAGSPSPAPAFLTPKPVVVKRRELERPVIKHYIITCMEVLNKGDKTKDKIPADVVPGDFIPIILTRGKITNIEGKEFVYSLIRNAKDSQKLLNYWTTTAAETVALAPKTPWIGTAKQFEGYETDYANANTENIPYLKYNVDSEAQGPPQRVPVAQPPQAVFQQISIARETLRSAIGMFGADLGESGSERTGAAINARQKPGDISTFVFMDHLASAIAHTGRIINSMIPMIYDTERDVRLRGVDDSESFVPVNTTIKEAFKLIKQHPERYNRMDINRLKKAMSKYGPNAKFNDLTVGKYDVFATIGPSYATQRAESADMMFKMFNSMPNQMGLASDLIVENLDFKDADKLARRLRKTLPPNILEQREGEDLGQAPPNPAMMAQQMKMQMEQAKLMVAQSKIEMEKLKLEREKMKLMGEIEMMRMKIAQAGTSDARDKELSRLMDAIERDRKYDLELGRLDLESQKFMHQMDADHRKIGIEEAKYEETNR